MGNMVGKKGESGEEKSEKGGKGPTLRQGQVPKGAGGWLDVRAFLARHVGPDGVDKPVRYTVGEVKALCAQASAVLSAEPSLLELEGPLSVAGNVNGQYRDLLAALCAGGYPPGIAANWLFLGDYIGRGCRSLECICFLLALKLLYPRNIFLLRGHHEERDLAITYGFKQECERRLGVNNAWELFLPVFEHLPLAAVINQPPHRIFAVHGGIGPGLRLEQILQIQRPCSVPRSGAVADLLWADVDPLTAHFDDSDRGVAHKFGKAVLRRFCAANQVALVLRSHQLVQEGFQFFTDQLLTIWTATGYNADFTNNGAILLIDKDPRILQLKMFALEAADDDADAEQQQQQQPVSIVTPTPIADPTQAHLVQEAAAAKLAQDAAKAADEVQDAPTVSAAKSTARRSPRTPTSPSKPGSGGSKPGSRHGSKQGSRHGSKQGSKGYRGSSRPAKGSRGSLNKRGSDLRSSPNKRPGSAGSKRGSGPTKPADLHDSVSTPRDSPSLAAHTIPTDKKKKSK